jgi:hypothetical protein
MVKDMCRKLAAAALLLPLLPLLVLLLPLVRSGLHRQ